MTHLAVHYQQKEGLNDDFASLVNTKDNDARFNDSEKSVDFVLVYTNEKKNLKHENGELPDKKRVIFEKGLLAQDLELENDVVGSLTFVKIHAPRSVLQKYCEILKYRMPIKESAEEKETIRNEFNLVTEVNKACKKVFQFFITIDPGNYRNKSMLMAEYSRDKAFMFDEDSPDFFTPTIRTLVVDFILNRQSWSDNVDDMENVGIQSLLDSGTYKAAYPLHDGNYHNEGCMRSQLYTEWAQLNKWIRLQPTDQIKDYLGVKCAIYFAWLGFYTQLLIPASICGIAVLAYGYFTLPYDYVSGAICNETMNITMCPLCDQSCDYWQLSDTCLYAKISYLFDNSFTVVFAFLMSVWATLFLELWKRYSAVLAHRWGLSEYTVQAEHPRPQYLARLAGTKHTKVNVVTGYKEPVVPFWFFKLPTMTFNYSIILTFMFIALGAVFSITLYRMWMTAILSAVNRNDWLAEHSSIVISVTSGLLNLFSIMLLNMLYDKIAVYLTEIELPRTQTDFDRSLAIKIYLFQFVNYYTSIIYVAFFKGKFVGSPAKYNRIFKFRQEECSPGGCFMELSIQLAIIMIGQQIFSSILEMIIPIGWNWFNQYSLKGYQTAISEEEDLSVANSKPWADDYKLLDWGTQGLFSEYLEVAMQFGFVTLFVSAFPLAPLFALLNNIFELRLDAQKILKYYRRPVPHQVPNIGVWYRILDVLGKLAVVTNATIIAFSSSFIPKLVFEYEHHVEDKEDGFLNFSLGYFNTGDFTDISRPLYTSYNVSMCRYNGYREPPWSATKYKRNSYYWKILVARLLFILIFQNVIYAVKIAVQWLIPDVPEKVSDQIKKEAYLTTQLIIKREKELALNSACRTIKEENKLAENNNVNT